MPNGSSLPYGDSAPSESPAEVVGLAFTSGQHLQFAASGSASYNSSVFSGPDGLDYYPFSRGDANGISGYGMTVNDLVGVFLGPDRPDLFIAPAALDFSSPAARDYLVLSPLLQQSFFIGDGLTSSGTIQEVVIPAGATRLFLGLADGVEWNNNGGTYRVTVDIVANPPAQEAVPEPTTFASFAIGFVSMAGFAMRHRRFS